MLCHQSDSMDMFKAVPVSLVSGTDASVGIPVAVLEGPRLRMIPLDVGLTETDSAASADGQLRAEPGSDELLDQLFKLSCVDQDLIRWMPFGPFGPHEAASHHAFLRSFARTPGRLMFIVRCKATNALVGFVGFLNASAGVSIEVGFIWAAAAFQGRRVAGEMTYLMMRYALGCCGFKRLEWKTHHLNAVSQKTALGIGFTYEGTFRKHMVSRGIVRNTLWYSIIDDEYEAVRAALEPKLAAAGPLAA
ncbi:acyl-CoA N-acyltransferase [Entophlyctis helioformis]|nr:acyl-CoA N-acyltransferase [Entophlyctis helioformis]